MKKQCLIIAAFLAWGNVAVNGQESLPFTQDFYDTATFNKMTVVDANEDGNSWTYASYDPVSYSPAARYTGNENAANEWMIAPGLELKAGYIYKFSMRAVGTAAYTNNVEVLLGNAASVEALTTSIASASLTTRANTYLNGEISVEADGTYYLGVHLTADANQSMVYVDDIKVEAGFLSAAPGAATSFVATPAIEDGKAVMKLSFVAPHKTNGGAALDEITGVKIYRGTTLIGELGAQTPGNLVEYTDATPALYNNSYKVVCINSVGEGAEVSANGYLSYSVPAAPANVVLVQEDGAQVITWDAVKVAASTSGLFIEENITYTITRSDKVEIAKGVKECKVTDNYSKDGEGQNLIYYNVVAVNEGGSSSATASNSILVGNPYTGEFAESFANYKYNTNTWQVVGGSGTNWQIKTSSYYSPAISADQDGNNGFVGFSSYTSGMEQRLVSPVINVSDMQNPRLSFYMYHASTTYTDMVIPEIFVNGEYIALNEGIYANGQTEGWTKYNFDLSKEQTAGDFQLSFKGIAAGGFLIAIDNITIKDALAHNLAVTALTAPANLTIGKEASIVASVKNTGVNVAADYKVVLYCNGNQIAEAAGVELASETSTEVAFSFVATPFAADKDIQFAAEVVYAADLNADDNSASVNVPVLANELPVPSALQAKANFGSVSLQWNAPVVPEVEVQAVKTESFEDWTVGSTDAFADWKFVDGDGAATYSYAYFEASTPMAFMTSSSSNVTPLTGSKYLVSIKNNSYRDYRNDWAISPQVVGGQTISFSVCQYGGYGYYGTTFEVCYSTTDNEVSSFVLLEKVTDKSSSWKQYSFTLPENATYFAIHVTDDGSSTSTAMAIDDIAFQPGSVQLVHTGYNVYRNENLIATITDKAVVNYEDANITDLTENLDYAVSALFETGESLASNVVTVINVATGIESVASDKAVFAANGAVNVCGFAGETLQVYTLAGQLVVSKTIATDNDATALCAGVYVVSVADKKVKVIIK